jgi:beta-glucanase (GH16 family)
MPAGGSATRKNGAWDSSSTPVKSFNNPNWDADYHIWRMDWDAESIKLYVDDQLLNEISVSDAINPGGHGPQHPFRQPQYLLLNLAIGGNNGGDPSRTKFPTRFEIDYVRVYQNR